MLPTKPLQPVMEPLQGPPGVEVAYPQPMYAGELDPRIVRRPVMRKKKVCDWWLVALPVTGVCFAGIAAALVRRRDSQSTGSFAKGYVAGLLSAPLIGGVMAFACMAFAKS